MRRAPRLLALLCACGPGMPAPVIVSIEPAEQSASDTDNVLLQLEAVLPLTLDNGRETVEVSRQLRVQIGPQLLDPGRYVGSGQFMVTVGPNMPVGVHDVRATLEDGRAALLPEGFTVTPALNITGFRIDPIPEVQYQGLEFKITIHAEGPDAALFKGTVRLESSRGELLRERTDPFIQGMRTETVVFYHPHANVTLNARDSAGRTGTSNEFRVAPR